MDKLKEYSGRDWAAVIVVAEMAKTLRENGTAELAVDIPQYSGGDLSIRMKR